MAAECEVSSCGVLAVGRCATCQQAFCATHQGRTNLTVFVDRCSACLAAEDEARTTAATRKSRAVQNARGRIAAAVTNLARAGIARPVMRIEHRRTIFGRYKSVETPVEGLWVVDVGDHLWRWHERNHPKDEYGEYRSGTRCVYAYSTGFVATTDRMLVTKDSRHGIGEGPADGVEARIADLLEGRLRSL